MKKLLLVCLFALMSGALFAQNAGLQDVVYLKNGSVIRGMIIEQVPGESLKIETRDGNVFVYQMDEISKMTREQAWNRSRIRPNQFSSKSNGYEGFVEAGYGIGVSGYAGRFERDIVNGYRFNPYCFLGGGVGFNIFTNGENFISIPVFIQGCFNLLDRNTSPFLTLNLGYNISTKRSEVYKRYYTTVTYRGGVIFEPALGVAFRVSNRASVTFGVGYSLMQLQSKAESSYYEISEVEKELTQAVRLKLGVTF